MALRRPPEEGGRLIDAADDGGGVPLAGDGKLKQAMVRVDFQMDGTQGEDWETAVEAAGWQQGASELGTPGSIPARLLPTPPPSLSYRGARHGLGRCEGLGSRCCELTLSLPPGAT